MNLPSASTLTNGTAFFLTFLSMLLAGLTTFDWQTFFTPDQSLKIVGLLNLGSLFVKMWMATVEVAAKNMVAK